MKESLNALCESFHLNMETIYKQKGFKLVSTKVMPMCSYTYITSGKAVEPERLQECLKLVESKGGRSLSGMRDAYQAPHACTLAVSDNPSATMDSDVLIFEKLKKAYTDSKYIGVAASLLPRLGKPEALDEKIARGRALFDALAKKHKMNTDFHDSLMTSIIAYSDKSDDTIADETEKIYTEIKPLTSGEYAQDCALILTCSDKTADEKIARFKELYEALTKDKKNKYSNGPAIVTLAALSLLDTDAGELTKDILEVAALLAQKKHYKGLISTFGRDERMLHAVMLVIADNMTDDKYVPAVAAMYLSVFYMYEIEQGISSVTGVLPLMV
ncbi:MAG: DUF4003 family protein [Ruminococcus sp.]|nr:DUF4003 family protein [Lachnospiraceae bacterium]MBR7007101.1 DUF4003 family protein [Ruminococcus sp.]